MNANYRIVIVQMESSDYEVSDGTPAQQEAELAAVDRDGVYGYRVEKLVCVCRLCGRPAEGTDVGTWDEVDSCYGFIGCNIEQNGMADHLAGELAGQRDVPVYYQEEYGDDSIRLSHQVDSYSAPRRRRAAK